MPLVSVIIPTFNRASTLLRAIDSVKAQTFKDFEIIVVDDASTDKTAEICGDLKGIRFERLDQNCGVSAARNHGAKISESKWIALLDSDDEWLPERLERQLSLASLNPDFPLIHGEEIWIRKGKRVNQKKIHQKEGGRLFSRALHLCLISPSATLMKREVYEELGGFREDYPVCEDFELWLRLTCRYDIGFIEEPIIKKYGGHEDQLSMKYRAMDHWRIKALDEVFANSSDFIKPEERRELHEVVLKKAEILINGYRKHNNLENLEFTEGLKKKHQSLLDH